MGTRQSPDWTRREFVTSATTALACSGFASQSFAAQEPAARQRRSEAGQGPLHVILDTDPGVDDALALLLAMRSPELKIEAITAVAGNVPLELTLPNALRMVEIAGRTEIPVAAGARAPLVRRLVTAAYAHGENGLGGAVFPEPKIKAVAERLGMSERSLRRHLATERATFPSLRIEVLSARAKQLLTESKLPIKEIASSMGFSDVTAFHRAFKTWTGMTAAAFRAASSASAQGKIR